jgi:hypothetical protein
VFKEHRTSNVQPRLGVVEWNKMKKQNNDLEVRLLEYSVRISKWLKRNHAMAGLNFEH